MLKIIKFEAPWCSGCKTLSKNLDAVNNKDEFILETIDVDIRSDLASEFGIRSIPTIILMDSNIEVKRHSGVKSTKDLEQWIEG